MLPYLQGRILDVGCGVGMLCDHVQPQHYVGIDIDRESLAIARKQYVDYTFLHTSEFEASNKTFDSIIGLAVIEHVKDPINFLEQLKKHLGPAGKIVLTTPHASFNWTHVIGSKVGLFSKAAQEEHEVLFDKKLITEVARKCGLTVALYKRFMIVNQLIILQNESRKV